MLVRSEQLSVEKAGPVQRCGLLCFLLLTTMAIILNRPFALKDDVIIHYCNCVWAHESDRCCGTKSLNLSCQFSSFIILPVVFHRTIRKCAIKVKVEPTERQIFTPSLAKVSLSRQSRYCIRRVYVAFSESLEGCNTSLLEKVTQ